MMRLLCYTMLLCSVVFNMSCIEHYSLKGNTEGFFDGSRAYLKIEENGKWNIVDSCEILHGKFEMCGNVSTPFVSSLFIGDEAVMPVVIENGNIIVDIDNQNAAVRGTALNNHLSDFIERKGQLEITMAAIERKEAQMILDGHTAESAAAYVRDSIAAVGLSLDNYVEEFIKQHYNTVLGPCVFRLLCSTMPYPFITTQIERILADAPQVFLDDDFVKEFVKVAEENKHRMKVD